MKPDRVNEIFNKFQNYTAWILGDKKEGLNDPKLDKAQAKQSLNELMLEVIGEENRIDKLPDSFNDAYYNEGYLDAKEEDKQAIEKLFGGGE